MAPLVKELEKHPSEFQTIVCVTGQHREMLDQVLRLFEIVPDYDPKVLCGFGQVLKKEHPDLVLVHGDTTTSMAAALAAFYEQIPVGHVEAGLRTGNIYSPWPEEMNRQITGRISVLDFAPTDFGRNNLIKENVPDSHITVTGNTVIDALHMIVDRLTNNELLAQEQAKALANAGYDVSRLSKGKKLVLITGHRRENFGDGFINIISAIKDLAMNYPDVDFVYPMHLNPNVRKPIVQVFCNEIGQNVDSKHINRQYPNVFFIEPLQYVEFVYLMEKAHIVLTDSGGIQEEAPGLGKPVLVMRDTTERPEALDAGTVHLVGTNYDLIVSEVSQLIDNPAAYELMSQANNPYGDGKACSRIVKILTDIGNALE